MKLYHEETEGNLHVVVESGDPQLIRISDVGKQTMLTADKVRRLIPMLQDAMAVSNSAVEALTRISRFSDNAQD